ncbi:MAG: hypothetical protein Q4Q04_04390 [Methanocorpusculum sp.]|nr:hypothetical protein [Methanocorpusculum sp.]
MSQKRWDEIPELADRAKLKRLVRRYGTKANIAAHIGCSEWSVKTALKRHGVKTIPRFLSAEGRKER